MLLNAGYYSSAITVEKSSTKVAWKFLVYENHKELNHILSVLYKLSSVKVFEPIRQSIHGYQVLILFFCMTVYQRLLLFIFFAYKMMFTGDGHRRRK
jgi:hypothetical protein